MVNIIGITPIQIDAQRILSISNGDDTYEPIPITEEWLLKFGFEKIIGSNESNFTNGFYNLFVNSLGEVNFYFFKEGDWYQKIDYVHQLQNLYFALTGSELTVA